MNTLLITGVFYPEPIAMSQIVKDMAVRLSELGHRVTVVTPQPCRPYGYRLPDEIDEAWWPFERIVLGSHIHPKSEFIGRYRENISFGRAVVRFIDRNHENIDVIYACVFPLFCQAMIVKQAKKHGIPVVMHVEDIYPEPFKYTIPLLGHLIYRLLLPIDRYTLQHSKKVVTIGPRLCDYLVRTRRLAPENVEYVYNWQNESKFLDVMPDVCHVNETRVPFTFMYVGSLSPAADLLNVGKAFIEAGLTGARFIFAGNGVMKTELQNLADSNPDSCIEFWDANTENAAKIHAQADVLVLPLKKTMGLRAFPSKFPPYLFSGKPVLAQVDRESDVADSIREANCGWLVKPGDHQKLIEMFRQICTMDCADLKTKGRFGLEYGVRKLTTECNLTKIVSIIITAAR